MDIWNTLILEPIFNLLLFIYSLVGDFGVAIILLTIIIRMILWPLVKKQLRQTKLMRKIQPQLKQIKKQAKGNRMLESQLQMNLYKENGIKPASSILVLLVQLPIFIAVFQVIRNYSSLLENHIYPFLQDFGRIPEMVATPESPSLLGLIDLTRWATGDQGIYWPLIVLALLAAGFQFYQSRQLQPKVDKKEKKKFSDYFRDAAAGKDVDQSEMTAQMTRNMMYFFPIMTFFIAISLPGAVVLYYAVQSAVAVAQQHIALSRDDAELAEIAAEPTTKAKKRADKAAEAVIVKKSKKDLGANKTSPKSGSGGATVVRRIKAK
ncbi:MAG: YidC/Oxa1 family membrane protein insertase [Candidatus Nomurabacteria bacterium]|jgi:YidC/Oxa1 family membrane protein insertase|nr:YidC/Oxa1 family membrane protein insertase [Candidatus Nomurabacteria bacterium]